MIPNGKFTFTNPLGEHRTFQIKTQNKEAKFAPGKRIVALLTGPDNDSDYQGFGFIENNQVRLWNSKITPAFKWYARMLSLLGGMAETDSEDIKGRIFIQNRVYEFSGSKRCVVCNRTLTDPESIKLQIGPICREGMAA